MIPAVTVRLQAFLRAFAVEEFCSSCLGDKIGVARSAAKQALAAVCEEVGVVYHRGRCSGCGRRTHVVNSRAIGCQATVTT